MDAPEAAQESLESVDSELRLESAEASETATQFELTTRTELAAQIEPNAARGRKHGTAVLKFGGSSLADADKFLRAGYLVQQGATEQKVAVVVSAMRGVTDQLYSLAASLERERRSRASGLTVTQAELIITSHREVVQNLNLGSQEAKRVSGEIDCLGRELLAEVNNVTSDGRRLETMDRIVSFGERFSCRIMAATLRKLGTKAVAVEAPDFLVTSQDFQNARPNLEATVARAREIFPALFGSGVVPVVTGFIGATLDGKMTTLGRNSSDFSAAIVAHALGASDLVIWTDVDGMYTENPRKSESARLLSQLSYGAAQALAASGAKVLHHDVIPLAAQTRMRVAIRNTLNPGARGTTIGPSMGRHNDAAQ